MRLPPYPKYKPSGVEWLGEVPEHWEVKPVKTIAKIRAMARLRIATTRRSGKPGITHG